MKLNYALDREDFLTLQLYVASHSPQVKKMRRMSWLIIPIIYGLIALIFWKDLAFSITFFVLGILWLIIYPFFQRKRYIKIYGRHLDEIYKNRFEKPIELTFGKDNISSKDYSGEGKMKLSEIEKINEIRNYFYIKFTTGVSHIIPKQKIEKSNEVKKFLKDLAKKHNIPYQTELEWQWK